MTFLWVALGAVVGAPLRYVTDRAVQSRHRIEFPFGTLTVNLVACFGLGLLTGLTPSLPTAVMAAVGTGLCATLSTYSTFSYETFALLERRAAAAAVLNVVGSVIAGVGVAALGLVLGKAML
ncbi:MAG: chromosome condensation protein CrcB [Pseudonocardia sp. SCN 72-86]|nr:MAG: chromosome condensation protein CrcB [Pseudonocardia sp. SCN 72-86]